MTETAKVHEIVIIRRSTPDHEESHHGGVWKIAFADFMTAMMAFFLVMWLISANDKTKATIARYFNPVQLVDATPQPRGLSDPKAGTPTFSGKPDKPVGDTKDDKDVSGGKSAAAPKTQADPEAQSDSDVAAKHDETRLFKDPYAVLAELAAKNSFQPVQQQTKAPADGHLGGSGAVGLKGGEAYRDPFEPIQGARPAEPALAQTTAAPTMQDPQANPAQDRTDAPAPDPTSTRLLSAPAKAQLSPAKAQVSPAEAQASALRAKIAALTAGPGPSAAAATPKVEVRRTDEGLLIGMTDGANFSMFASASAEPTPKMVAFMEKIGRLLKTEKGSVILRGYTDSRPFKSDTYDNWRLSSARAQMAHYMLVRGGLDDHRIDRIEGYADRHPKNPKAPESPENRRIEILLRDAPQ